MARFQRRVKADWANSARMKFIDEVHIHVKGGNGGNGAVAFRREKYVDKGGPSGGDGGNGGSVIFVADEGLTTLLDFRYQQQYAARNGQNGMGSDCNGRNADDLTLKVPVGTIVTDETTGETLADISKHGEIFVAAQGGRGGLGNINFANSTRQTPRFAEDGTPGQERSLVLELKLLADVGLLGFPNAGKSTFISRVSRARPKIADYPFTTLTPNLGVVQYKDRQSFVMADIPGLIEGASEGIGLGLQFLRHVERCRVLVHLIDLSAVVEERDPVNDVLVLNRELQHHSQLLAQKPQVIVANKLDLPHAQEALAAFTEKMNGFGIQVLSLSGATGEGATQVLDAVARVLFSTKPGAEKLTNSKGLRLFTTADEFVAAASPAKKKRVAVSVAKKKPTQKVTAKKVKPRALTDEMTELSRSQRDKARTKKLGPVRHRKR